MNIIQLLPLLLLLLPGYLALELAAHITPKAFRAAGDGQKTLVSLVMGMFVLCLFSLTLRLEPREGWRLLEDFEVLNWTTVALLLLSSIASGLLWTGMILVIVPLFYRAYGKICARLNIPAFAGYHSLFERAVQEFDRKNIVVYLKNRRVAYGSVLACPSQDEDEHGLLMRLSWQGIIEHPDEQPWKVTWDDLRPAHQPTYEGLLYIPEAEIELIKHLPEAEPEPPLWQGLERLNPPPPVHPAEEFHEVVPLPPRPAVTEYPRIHRPRKHRRRKRSIV